MYEQEAYHHLLHCLSSHVNEVERLETLHYVHYYINIFEVCVYYMFDVPGYYCTYYSHIITY